jgi:peptidoglycan/xylan/chitin deacetylase (PgdA/CDA1 family)
VAQFGSGASTALAAAFVVCVTGSAAAQTHSQSDLTEPTRPARMAITIDDLPWVGLAPGGAETATERLLATLAEYDVTATGFVVCDQVGSREKVLAQWLDAGMALGNHSAAHRDINTTDLDTWLEDVRRCSAEMYEITGKPGGYFRYPLLHQGSTRAVRDSVVRALASWGYRQAHVTVDNSEWVLARAYNRAIEEGDALLQNEIATYYVNHLLDAARHFRLLAQERFGREVDQVLLLHANTLAADHLGSALGMLRVAGFEFIDLETALMDPVYDLPDGYVGPRGLSWLYRAEPTISDDPWDEAAEAELMARFAN